MVGREIWIRVAAAALVCSWIAPPSPARAETVGSFAAGQRVTGVRVQGNRTTRTFVVRREIRTHRGHPLDPEALRADVQRLHDLDIFSSVHVAVRDSAGGAIVTFRVREIPSVVPYVSYDVTDEDGWSFGPALKSVNLLGLDLAVAGYALFGGKNTFLLDLNYPWLAGNHISLDLTVARIERRNELDGFRETSLELAPWLGTYLGDHGRAGVGGSYLRMESDLTGYTLGGDRQDELIQAGVRLGLDTRDSLGDPHAGWLCEARVCKTGGWLSGDGDYWSLNLDGRRYQPAPAGQTLVLAGLLTLQTGNVGDQVPVYMDYHLGGSNSVRGHSVSDLGARLYGRNQWLGTAEYRFPLLSRHEYEVLGMAANLGLAGAAFVDYGLAWSRDAELDLGRGAVGFGAGVRMLLPAVEMTRLDVGFDLHGAWRIHFAAFSKMTAQRLRLR
jgi:outer membrane protein insertion porin family